MHQMPATSAPPDGRAARIDPPPGGAADPVPVAAADPLRGALLESRQRWRDLVAISTDMAFETDAQGRFVFLSPEQVVGWPVNSLLGRSGELLLPEFGEVAGFNPFVATTKMRHRRCWLKRPDGTLCWMSFSMAPLSNAEGQYSGTRGVARDVSETDRAETAMAQALRRSELIDLIVCHMRTEIMAPRMMKQALRALIGTLGADGAMIVESAEDVLAREVVDIDPDDLTGARDLPPAGLLHVAGEDILSVREMTIARLRGGLAGPAAMRGPDGHACLVCATPTRFDGCPGLVIWRQPGGRVFDADDLSLLGAAIGTVRVVLEHGSIQQEMSRQARTDALTGLYNRRAFTEDLARRLDRLERDLLPGTLMFVDLDNFKALNDAEGHEAGDVALRMTGKLLRTASRAGDMVARLGGDEFAIWFDGMDDLAAAERADRLCREAPSALHDGRPHRIRLAMSIGIATRWAGSGLGVTDLLRQADAAMYEVKRGGRSSWRVWRESMSGRGDVYAG